MFTESIQLRDAVARDRLSALGSIVAGIAHEVNNPLAVLKAGARFLAEELPALCTNVDRELAADILASVAEGEVCTQRIQRERGEFGHVGPAADSGGVQPAGDSISGGAQLRVRPRDGELARLHGALR
jgi:signal transduction histidine kinase